MTAGILAGLAAVVAVVAVPLALTWLSARHRTDRRRDPIDRDQR